MTFVDLDRALDKAFDRVYQDSGGHVVGIKITGSRCDEIDI